MILLSSCKCYTDLLMCLMNTTQSVSPHPRPPLSGSSWVRTARTQVREAPGRQGGLEGWRVPPGEEKFFLKQRKGVGGTGVSASAWLSRDSGSLALPPTLSLALWNTRSLQALESRGAWEGTCAPAPWELAAWEGDSTWCPSPAPGRLVTSAFPLPGAQRGLGFVSDASRCVCVCGGVAAVMSHGETGGSSWSSLGSGGCGARASGFLVELSCPLGAAAGRSLQLAAERLPRTEAVGGGPFCATLRLHVALCLAPAMLPCPPGALPAHRCLVPAWGSCWLAVAAPVGWSGVASLGLSASGGPAGLLYSLGSPWYL